MAQPYIGEIRMFSGTFNPLGWEFCNGQLIPIAENDALFQLIGTTYGGDGQENFALPNLQSRSPMHFGTGPSNVTYPQAQQAGVETVTLTTQQIPVHNHAMLATDSGHTLSPENAVLATVSSSQTGANAYVTAATTVVAMAPASIAPTGGSQPHENMQPFLGINHIISMFGIFPSPT